MTVITQLDTSTPAVPQAQIAHALSRVAADAAVLRLKIQSARWHVAGPGRQGLADLLGEREGELTHLLNLVAGRLRALGFKVPAGLASHPTYGSIGPDPVTGDEPAGSDPGVRLRGLRADLECLIASCRTAHAMAEPVDAPAAARLAAQLRVLERAAWMLSAQAADG
ncbi:hypothetical protein CKO28_19080 [Rhodovibrio sodomensis]|uniref:Ferritin/DPS domain-containing protein n=1 Tax=Rhodovibrio sodomensis TaxID=1088 RepID=A0ABS1DKW1_9PROT|nr:ferritin-like domain-containing protein [Rhodovibrio sodomensis]MBK1670143.1 hypothetical protein [Rhodovibrio sodomensis]